MVSCLSLHWESGLKYFDISNWANSGTSLPSLGEWIEISESGVAQRVRPGLSLHWESGLKCDRLCPCLNFGGLSLHWESGLKYCPRVDTYRAGWSLPSLGEWIEISSGWRSRQYESGLSLHWESGLKFLCLCRGARTAVSPFIGRVD